MEGDVAANLARLLPLVDEKPSRPEWFAQIDDWKKRLPFAYEKETEGGLIKPQSVIEKLSNLTADIKDKTVITTGVGQHQMWTAQVLKHDHCLLSVLTDLSFASAFPVATPQNHDYLRWLGYHGLW